MKVTIHQPEHFPYIGFFKKMNEADVFVILDNVKFKKNDFQNRNRFINRSGNEEWFTVPVEKDANSKLINEVKVSKDPIWRSKIIKQHLHNKYNVAEIYEDSELLIDINMKSIEWCRNKWKIQTPMIKASSLKASGSKSELLLSICKEVGATTYISGKGGIDYLDKKLFDDANINVEFFDPKVDNMMSSLYNQSTTINH